MTACAHCGTPLPPQLGPGRPKVYCSPVCLERARARRDEALKAAGRAAVEAYREAITDQGGAVPW
ncbi:hypothetical protein HDA40_003437 [Hamadaea flava]|nr:hypothetical protein [Hamadaea flava]